MSTPDVVTAAWDGSAGAVVGRLLPQSYGRRIQRIALVGPNGSVFSVYRGYVVDPSALVLTTGRGERNTYEAAGDPVEVGAGEALTFTWAGGAAGAGTIGRATITSDLGE